MNQPARRIFVRASSAGPWWRIIGASEVVGVTDTGLHGPSGALRLLGTSLQRRLAAFWTQCMSDTITQRSSEMLKGATTEKQIKMNPLALQPWKPVKRPRAIHHVKPIDPNSRMARAEEEAKNKPKYIKPEAIVPVKDEDPEIEEVVTDEELHAMAREMNLNLNYAIGQTRARQEVLARRQRQRQQQGREGMRT